jgi:23S rRNA pseudouridine1911/1915/1917 synthase
MVRIGILHEDDHLLVIDKPAGVLVGAAPGKSGPTLLDLLSAQQGYRVQPVHRIDEGTTGALVVVKTDAARVAMEDLFRAHSVERHYLALVTGTPSPAAGIIQSQLDENGDVVRVVQRGGRTAITRYETLARRGRFCLVQCQLETGRRNQIRAHMQALGCPLAGDRKYGFRVRAGESFPRPMLHSFRLAFRHPLLGTDVRVESLAPEAALRP